jgi:midasin
VVQGAIGCGKSHLIRELATLMGQDKTLVELHVNEQTDFKTLLGSYICSDVPGEFIWQSGIVTQAVTKGFWVVIENIEKVPMDFVASISLLLEFRRLYLPQIDMEVKAHPNFRMISTRAVEPFHLATCGISLIYGTS